MTEPPEDAYMIYCKGRCVPNAFIVIPISTYKALIPAARHAIREWVCQKCQHSKCMAPIEQLEKEAS